MKPNYRRCISCYKIALKESFWRVTRDYVSHQVQLNSGMGRSAYICPQADCLQKARYKNRLGRTLKAHVPEQIYQQLQERLVTSPKKT